MPEKWSLSKYKDKVNGGMTAAWVAQYKKENPGSNLKVGVNKTPTTPEEKRRQWAFLTRFFGQKNLPPLVKPNGEPTRLALSAKKWNSPVPSTKEDAQKLYNKGKALLEAYKKSKEK
jgi:hypothetical protein